MKNKIDSNFEQYSSESSALEYSEQEKKEKKILRFLDEKIVEINGFFNEVNFDEAKKAGVGECSLKKMLIIQKNILKLIPLINNSEIKIIKDSHLSDRLGNFCGCLGLAERIIRKKKAENVSEKLIKLFENEIIRYHNYFSECAVNADFLKIELETVEGVKTN